ncbi:MAG: lysophospholipid acyltransferase family protein [Patescibacteria group bacterium]
MAYAFSRHIFGPLLRRRIASAEGLGTIPKSGPALFVANHVGLQDPILLMTAVILATGGRKVHAITKWKIFETWPLHPWLETIPLAADPQQTLHLAQQYLEAGELVLIYPEAKVNPLPTIAKVKTGAARLALQTKVPVFPVGLQRTTPPAQTEREHFQDMFFGKVRIAIGSAINLQEFHNRTIDRPLLDTVMRAIMTPVATLASKTYVG